MGESMECPSRLKCVRIAITGGAGTLGSRLAERLVAEGARIVIGDLAADAVEDAAAAIHPDRATIAGMAVDVTSDESTDAFIANAAEHLGGLDVVINNAGVLPESARLHHVRLADFKRTLDVNVLGVFNGMKSAIEHMRSRGGGTIINTASVTGLRAWTYSSAYGASKAAVIQLSKVAALEYVGEGIRVNCVCPGTFLSPMLDGLSADALAMITARHPIGRLASVDEILGAFVYLASPESSFTTGSTIVVDGGNSC